VPPQLIGRGHDHREQERGASDDRRRVAVDERDGLAQVAHLRLREVRGRLADRVARRHHEQTGADADEHLDQRAAGRQVGEGDRGCCARAQQQIDDVRGDQDDQTGSNRRDRAAHERRRQRPPLTQLQPDESNQTRGNGDRDVSKGDELRRFAACGAQQRADGHDRVAGAARAQGAEQNAVGEDDRRRRSGDARAEGALGGAVQAAGNEQRRALEIDGADRPSEQHGDQQEPWTGGAPRLIGDAAGEQSGRGGAEQQNRDPLLGREQRGERRGADDNAERRSRCREAARNRHVRSSGSSVRFVETNIIRTGAADVGVDRACS
jgi:hypothetical protein